MKQHLKSIASPRTWMISRERLRFTVKPHPSGHPLEFGLPLGIIIRDILKLASTMAEVKKMLHGKDVLVDGKRRKDHRFLVGLFDVLSFSGLKKAYRIVLDNKGRIIIIDVPAAEQGIKLGKIIGKTALGKNKIQFNLHDGKNIISDQNAKVGDSFLLSLPDLKIKEVFSLKPGAHVFLTKGKHSGDLGQLKELREDVATYTVQGNDIETAKNYLFVVGEKKAEITLDENKLGKSGEKEKAGKKLVEKKTKSEVKTEKKS